jgi:preprotein translocase subunit YajC
VAAVDLIPFVLILLAFYLLIVRPGRNRARAAAELQERLAPGVEVMTTSGMYGTIVEIDEESISLEVAPGTTIRFAKAAVGQVRSPELADAADGSAAEDDLAVDDDLPGDGTTSGPADPTLRPDRDSDPRDDHSTR